MTVVGTGRRLVGAAVAVTAVLSLAATPPRVTLAPLALLTRWVHGNELAENELAEVEKLLTTELSRNAKLTYVPFDDELRAPFARAQEALASAQQLRAKGDLERAAAAAQRALTAYAQLLPQLPNFEELADAHELAAAIAFQLGKDEEALPLLHTAIVLNAGRTSALAESSPLFRAAIAATTAELRAKPPGRMSFTCTSGIVPLTVDGRAVGATPLIVDGATPGRHLFRAGLAASTSTAGFITVDSDKQLDVDACPSATGAAPRLVAALRNGSLDEATVRAAKEFAASRNLDAVFVGGLGRRGSKLILSVNLIPAGDGPPRNVLAVALDKELISAGQAINRAVANIDPEAGTSLTLPAPLCRGCDAEAAPPAPQKVSLPLAVPASPTAAPASSPAAPPTPATKPAERETPRRRAPLR